MKLFTKCKNCGYKIFINQPAKIRQELPNNFAITCSNCKHHEDYFSFDVIAESGLTTAAGVVLGGLLGLALGGPGAIVGALLGGILGKTSQDNDEKNVKRFNDS